MTRLIGPAVAAGLLGLSLVTRNVALLAAAAMMAAVALAVWWPPARNAMLVAASVLACLVTAELFFMAQGRGGDGVTFLDPATGVRVDLWSAHADYGVMPRPGRYRARKEGGTGLVYEALYTIAPDRFRATPQAGAPDRPHAYFLGGSSTFGEGLNDDETLPHHWSLLDGKHTVRNRGVSGWGLHQAYSVWQAEITEPDAVVIVQTAPWGAERAACLAKFSGLSPRFVLRDGEPVRAGKCRSLFGGGMVDGLLMRSHVAQKVYDAVYRQTVPDEIALYLGLLEAMQTLADERGQCLVVAFNRAPAAYLDDVGSSNREIIAALRHAGVRLVDVSLADPIEALDPAYFIAGDGHPTAAANQAKAGLLAPADRLCDRHRLSASRSSSQGG